MQYLLDSVILIDHFNGIDAATRFLSRHQKQIGLSVITRAEVLAGFVEHDLLLAKALLNKFVLLPLSSDDADLAASLRQKFRWKLPDAFQAAVAQNNKMKLVTRNTKDFPKMKHGFVMIPYEL